MGQHQFKLTLNKAVAATVSISLLGDFMKRNLMVFLALALGGLGSAGLAQTSSQQRVQQLEKLEEELNSPNPNVRLAAMEAAMQSESPAIRSRAMSIGLSSSDPTLFEIAVRAKVCSVDQTSISFATVSGSHSVFDDLNAGLLSIKIIKCDPNTGLSSITHNMGVSARSGTIKVNQKSVNIDLSFYVPGGADIRCTSKMKFVEGLTAKGSLACSWQGATFGPTNAEIDFN